MALMYVTLSRVVSFEFADSIEVPDDVIDRGRQAIRDYLGDLIGEYACDRETLKNVICFERAD